MIKYVVYTLSFLWNGFKKISTFYKWIGSKLLQKWKQLGMSIIENIRQKNYKLAIGYGIGFIMVNVGVMAYIGYTLFMGGLILFYAGPLALFAYLLCKFSGVCVLL